jgi:hypothetical protein
VPSLFRPGAATVPMTRDLSIEDIFCSFSHKPTPKEVSFSPSCPHSAVGAVTLFSPAGHRRWGPADVPAAAGAAARTSPSAGQPEEPGRERSASRRLQLHSPLGTSLRTGCSGPLPASVMPSRAPPVCRTPHRPLKLLPLPLLRSATASPL